MQNILLVDDNKSDVILAKIEIERMGFSLNNLDVAESLKAARTFLSVKEYQVIFLDYKLSDGDGTELLNDIDREKTTVVMLSGVLDVDAIKRHCNGDIQGVKIVPKPLRERDLDGFIDEMRIEKKVQKRVRARCIAFWSVASATVGVIGGFFAENSTAAKAAFKTFMDVWLAK